MNLINKKINHETLGEGIITGQEEASIIADFSGEIKTLRLDVAIKFLSADADTMKELQEIADKELKRQEEEKRIEKEKQIQKEKERISNLQQNNRKKIHGITNIAFKCNYNDGGFSNNKIGFCGVCSDEQIKYNQKSNKSWCSNENCMCQKYMNKQITREELEKDFVEHGFTCYEAQALIKFSFSAGCDHDKETGMMRARHIQLPVRKGSVVFLTTVDNNESGENRYIFAAYIVDNMEQVGEFGEDAYGCNNDEHRVFLNKEKAKQVKFWDYHKNPNNPDSIQWGTGLYREVLNEEAINILKKMKEVDNSISAKIDKMLSLFANK